MNETRTNRHGTFDPLRTEQAALRKDRNGPTAIIARLDAADEGCDLLSALLHQAVYGGTIAEIDGVWMASHSATGFLHADGVLVPRYTDSVDAALTLLPPGWVLARVRRTKVSQRYQIKTSHVVVGSTGPEQGRQQHAEHRSVTIAICKAALRARLDTESGAPRPHRVEGAEPLQRKEWKTK